MLKGFVDVDASELFERVAPDSISRGHGNKLVHLSVRINVRQHFFAVRIIQFGILFRQMLSRPSRFLVSRRASLTNI